MFSEKLGLTKCFFGEEFGGFYDILYPQNEIQFKSKYLNMLLTSHCLPYGNEM